MGGKPSSSSSSSSDKKDNNNSKNNASADKSVDTPTSNNSAPWEDVVKGGFGVHNKQASTKLLFSKEQMESLSSGIGSEDSTDSGINGLYFSCAVQGFRKDQDRFVCFPDLLDSPKVLFSGLFDGHGRDGDLIAEKVAVHLPKLLREKLKAKVNIENIIPLLEKTDIETALSESFREMQKNLDEEFEKEIVEPTMKLKLEIEKSQNVPLGDLPLPLGSGTTATTFLFCGRYIYCAHVGDSRAVLCSVDPADAGALIVEDLSHDHNISSATEDELSRVKAAGGTVFGKHVGGDYVDGMLQLTRSLGDCPLHRKNIVIEEPAIKVKELDHRMMFIVAASDGLWDHFTSREACKQIISRMKVEMGDSESSKNKKGVHEVLLRISTELENEAAARASKSGHQSDDTSVMIMVLSKWW